MKRRAFLKLTALSGVSAFWAGAAADRPHVLPVVHHPRRLKSFGIEELAIPKLQALIDARKLTAVSLVKKYLARIEAIDRRGPRLNAVIELNPDALAIAAELDAERLAKGRRGPLHGIPMLIKDNIDTHDRMTTTAGSLALKGSIPLRDAFLVERLRAAGAVLLGKTNLSE